VLTNWY